MPTASNSARNTRRLNGAVSHHKNNVEALERKLESAQMKLRNAALRRLLANTKAVYKRHSPRIGVNSMESIHSQLAQCFIPSPIASQEHSMGMPREKYYPIEIGKLFALMASQLAANNKTRLAQLAPLSVVEDHLKWVTGHLWRFYTQAPAFDCPLAPMMSQFSHGYVPPRPFDFSSVDIDEVSTFDADFYGRQKMLNGI